LYVHHTAIVWIVVRRGEEIRCWATENVGFIAEVQRNLGLDFVTKQVIAVTSAGLQLSVNDVQGWPI